MVNVRYGITGNYYVTSDIKAELVEVCKQIFKSSNSIYWNKKHKVWAIRIKSKKHKSRVKKLLL
jgi:hypothetical protein